MRAGVRVSEGESETKGRWGERERKEAVHHLHLSE